MADSLITQVELTGIGQVQPWDRSLDARLCFENPIPQIGWTYSPSIERRRIREPQSNRDGDLQRSDSTKYNIIGPHQKQRAVTGRCRKPAFATPTSAAGSPPRSRDSFSPARKSRFGNEGQFRPWPSLAVYLTVYRTSTIIHLDVKIAASIWGLGGFFSWIGDKGYPTKEIS